MKDSIWIRLKAWVLKQYRYWFIPTISNYAVPEGERLFEMNLITGIVKKAEYKNHSGHKIFVKNENCIYEHAINIRNAKIKFDTLINNALKTKNQTYAN